MKLSTSIPAYLSKKKLSFYALLLIAASLPYAVKLSSISIIIFIIVWIIEGDFKLKFEKLKSEKFIWLFCGFYLLHLIWMVITQNTRMGNFELEKKLSLMLFPLTIGTIVLSTEQMRRILLVFILSCAVATIICYAHAFFYFLQTGDLSGFSLAALSEGIKIHRVYFSMYLLLCAFILLSFLNAGLYRKFILLQYILLFHFVVFITLLASRAALIVLCVSLVILVIAYLRNTRNYSRVLITGGILAMSISAIIFFNPRIQSIIQETYTDLDKGNSDYNATGPNIRVIIWKSGVEVLKQHFWTGVGTGDVDDALYEKYVQKDFIYGKQERYNAHNQYLQTGIGLGIIGLTAFLLNLFLPAIKALKWQSFLTVAFLLSFAIFCLPEAMLCTQKGTVYYGFFNSLLVFHFMQKKENL